MDDRVVTQRGRERAANEARALGMGRTMMKVLNGFPEEDIWNMAFSEHLEIHRNCPCCRGSQINARLVSDHIRSLLKDYPVDPTRSCC
ncbi:MAG: hypothetical protein HYT62_04355 [Candidatus Yanofskybacteria bacterium]|nr:hypothetical protein [Candidatus Yanofskybacteria bacterium]